MLDVEGVDLRLGVGERRARGKAGEHIPVIVVAVVGQDFLGPVGGGAVELSAAGEKAVITRQYSGDGDCDPVVQERAAEHVGISVEMCPPKTIGQHGHGTAGVGHFLVGELFQAHDPPVAPLDRLAREAVQAARTIAPDRERDATAARLRSVHRQLFW